MIEPATATWGVKISNSDFERLKVGFEPQMMEDRWHFKVTDPSQNGTHDKILVHISRSWTGKECYVLSMTASNGGGSSSSGVKIENITWEQNLNENRISEEQAKKGVVLLCRHILRCDFEGLPEYSTD